MQSNGEKPLSNRSTELENVRDNFIYYPIFDFDYVSWRISVVAIEITWNHLFRIFIYLLLFFIVHSVEIVFG